MNKMELKILESKKNRLKLEVVGEGHTFCNLLKDGLWEAGADVAGYNLEHPLIGEPWLLIEGDNPEKTLTGAVNKLRSINKDLRAEFKKIK